MHKTKKKKNIFDWLIKRNLVRRIFFSRKIKQLQLGETDVQEFCRMLVSLASIDRHKLESKHGAKRLEQYERELKETLLLIEEMNIVVKLGNIELAMQKFEEMKLKFLSACDEIYGIDEIKKMYLTRNN